MSLAIPNDWPYLKGHGRCEQLYQGDRTLVYRALWGNEQKSVVVKLLRTEYPSFGELVQFRNQYQITKNLPIPGIVAPLGLEAWRNGYALIMEDFGGISLGKYIREHELTWQEGLAIALQFTDILHDLSKHRIIHKDIKPANLLIHPKTRQIKLIDFGIASLLPRENQEIKSPSDLEGSLAYMAPEQTGRMNRGIDYRTDFYGLGVTLYELLTQRLPFQSKDPMELVHCHIARVPMPVHKVNRKVPAQISAIVQKLMAKNAEERYQSALGLKHDLEQCLQQWETTGRVRAFDLGGRDIAFTNLVRCSSSNV